MSKIIGVDVDGVLAAFNVAYIKLWREQGLVMPDESDAYPDTWYYERAAGATKEQERVVWDQINADEEFWLRLPSYPDTMKILHQLRYNIPNSDVYFITNRSGKQAKYQTEEWLFSYGLEPFHPTVVLTKEKGSICKALKVTHYIDDKDENCLDVAATSPATKCFMLKRPWNHQLAGIPRLDSIMDFLKIVKEG